jgi:hypothetical protein
VEDVSSKRNESDVLPRTRGGQRRNSRIEGTISTTRPWWIYGATTLIKSDHRYKSTRPGRLGCPLLACLGLLLWNSDAHGGTVLQFNQTNPADFVTATQSAGVTTLSTGGNIDGGNLSIAVTITNFLGTPGLNIPAFETLVNFVSVGPATSVGSLNVQPFTGIIEITGGIGGTGPNFLTVAFTNSAAPGFMTGLSGGDQVSVNVNNPPQTVVFTSDFAPLAVPLSVTLGFSNVEPAVHLVNNSFASFTGQNTGTFGATIIPEPASLSLACTGLVFVSLAIRYARRRRA